MINTKIPRIVAEVYEKRGEWQEAYEYLKLANLDEDEKSRRLLGYKIENALFNALRRLNASQRNQVLAFTKLIVELEPRLRRFVRATLMQSKKDWRQDLKSMFNDAAKRMAQPETSIALPQMVRRDELEWLTLSELLDFVTSDAYWGLFKQRFGNRVAWQGSALELKPIRNCLAHAIPLSDEQFHYLLPKVDAMLKVISTNP